MSFNSLTTLAYRVVALFEAFTWAGLLVGMYFKYLGGGSELGVQIFGPLHGGAFVAYGIVTLVAAYRLRWGLTPALVALAASVPPFGTLVADRWLQRTERLDPERVESTEEYRSVA